MELLPIELIFHIYDVAYDYHPSVIMMLGFTSKKNYELFFQKYDLVDITYMYRNIASSGFINIIKWLNWKSNGKQLDTMSYACITGQFDVLKWAIDRVNIGCELYDKDYGMLIVHGFGIYANLIKFNHSEMFEWLLEKVIKICSNKEKNKLMDYITSYAVLHGKLTILKYIHAQYDLKSVNDITSLYYNAISGMSKSMCKSNHNNIELECCETDILHCVDQEHNVNVKMIRRGYPYYKIYEWLPAELYQRSWHRCDQHSSVLYNWIQNFQRASKNHCLPDNALFDCVMDNDCLYMYRQ